MWPPNCGGHDGTFKVCAPARSEAGADRSDPRGPK